MKYTIRWKDKFGRECRSERPETWQGVGLLLASLRASGHYMEGSLRAEPAR